MMFRYLVLAASEYFCTHNNLLNVDRGEKVRILRKRPLASGHWILSEFVINASTFTFAIFFALTSTQWLSLSHSLPRFILIALNYMIACEIWLFSISSQRDAMGLQSIIEKRLTFFVRSIHQ